MNDRLLREGAGFFVYSDRAAEAHREICVFYSSPLSGFRSAPIIIAMHGIDRAAAEFRDVMASQCARNGQIVLVPEFDTRQFPDFYAYNFGGVRLPPPSNTRSFTGDELTDHYGSQKASGARSHSAFASRRSAAVTTRIGTC